MTTTTMMMMMMMTMTRMWMTSRWVESICIYFAAIIKHRG
jgi:hypothetical protein